MYAEVSAQIPDLEEKIADFVESLGLSDHQFDTLQGLLVDFRGAVTIKAMIDGLETASDNNEANQA